MANLQLAANWPLILINKYNKIKKGDITVYRKKRRKKSTRVKQILQNSFSNWTKTNW